MWETWVRFLGWEDPLEKGTVTTPVFSPGEFHGLFSPWGRSQRVRHNWATFTFVVNYLLLHYLIWNFPYSDYECNFCLFTKHWHNSLQEGIHLRKVLSFPTDDLIVFPKFLFSLSAMSNSLWPHGLSTPGFPVLYHLPELAQTHVHWVSDAIQPSHPQSSPSPPVFNLSQHQGLF